MAARLLALSGIAMCVVVALLRRSWAQSQIEDGSAFVLQAAARSAPARALPASPAGRSSAAASEGTPEFSTAVSSALACAAAALLYRGASRSSSRVTRGYQPGAKGGLFYEREWWKVEETRDPTSLPIWQRDFNYAYKTLIQTMKKYTRMGEKKFWDVRVIEERPRGCLVELLDTGLIGFCRKRDEGRNGERLKVGDEVKMECMAAPTMCVKREPNWKPWKTTGDHHPIKSQAGRVLPYFSYRNFVQHEANVKKAQDINNGDIVMGTVKAHMSENRGMLIVLDGEEGLEAEGKMLVADLSRQLPNPKYVVKMFPPGTRLKMFVVHVNKENGRITLSCKEFEDDDHIGWMLNFPERILANAEKSLDYYYEKKELIIRGLQGPMFAAPRDGPWAPRPDGKPINVPSWYD